MPTTIPAFTDVHRLAALIAVEREAADTYRSATHDEALACDLYGCRSEQRRAAAVVLDEAQRAWITAQIQTDELLGQVAALVARPDRVVP